MPSPEDAADGLTSAPSVALVVEDADCAMLGMDPERSVPTPLIAFCQGALGILALRPDEVKMVIAGDFVESVKARLPDGPYRDSFDLERGAGSVGAKTLVVDGEVHVVFPAFLFLDSDAAREHLSPQDAEQITASEVARANMARRTASHEAQHVAMEQAGEDKPDFTAAGWARQNFLNVAHQVISEYRAELGVPLELREEYETEFPLDSLSHLQSALQRYVANYDRHRDIDRLAHEVVQETHHVWKALAYLVAARRVTGSEVGAPFADNVVESDLWRLMAEDHWDDLERLLSVVPFGGVRIDPSDLERWTDTLADALDAWLADLGFVWEDLADGRSRFWMVPADFIF
ncbi:MULTISPECIES: hypothetical protein [unclassified Microbacterium]|uniref:hypothetical protein n=1 Tax=unclassified Microbacterium TaxID=2609290 RepID=UPI0010F7EBCA|nr:MULTISPECIES: hypothetical protein [unclassified Microbacterium]